MDLWAEVAIGLVAGEVLSYGKTYDLMNLIMTGQLGEIRLAAYLSLLQARGVSVDELRALADSMRAHAVKIDLPEASLDIVGTGGDKAGTANFSSMASIIAASCGVPVVKHGNRSATSACGAADALESLGLKLNLDNDQIVRIFREIGLAFLFANKFHPAMKYAAPVRRALEFRTVFNLLGPLSNPVGAQAMAVGVAQKSAAPLVAGVFASRGNSALVFRGETYGLDELTNVEPARIWEVRDGEVSEHVVDFVAELDLRPATLEELKGGQPDYNASLIRQVVNGENQAMVTVACLNAAAGLVSAEPVVKGLDLGGGDLLSRFKVAFQMAKASIAEGKAKRLLDQWIELSN